MDFPNPDPPSRCVSIDPVRGATVMMAPSRLHERIAARLDKVAEEPQGAGAEADCAFYVGETAFSVHPSVTRQECSQALTRLQLGPLQVLARPRQVAHRLLLLVRHPHRPQHPRPMQTRQHQRIAPVRLHPLTRTTRDQARRHHLGAPSRQSPDTPVPARTRLVAEAHHLTVRAQCPNQPQQRLALILDLAPVHRLLMSRQRHRHRNRVLVNVQSDVCATLVHDLPSSWWLCVDGS